MDEVIVHGAGREKCLENFAAGEACDAVVVQTAGPFSARLVFTGSGSAYFRSWVLNTLLTLLTLGLYSPWAKVRKARWFAQHTRLLGDSFDYHGVPQKMLMGRSLALVLLLAHDFAFDWSVLAGWATLTFLLVLGPALMASAQRFRLQNSSWRGLRFGFKAPPLQVYACCMPMFLFFLVPVGLSNSDYGAGDAWFKWYGLAVLLAMLWAHVRLKALQRQYAK